MLERRDKYVNVCDTVKLIGGGGGFFSAMAKSWKKWNTSNVFLIFCVLETK